MSESSPTCNADIAAGRKQDVMPSSSSVDQLVLDSASSMVADPSEFGSEIHDEEFAEERHSAHAAAAATATGSRGVGGIGGGRSPSSSSPANGSESVYGIFVATEEIFNHHPLADIVEAEDESANNDNGATARGDRSSATTKDGEASAAAAASADEDGAFHLWKSKVGEDDQGEGRERQPQPKATANASAATAARVDPGTDVAMPKDDQGQGEVPQQQQQQQQQQRQKPAARSNLPNQTPRPTFKFRYDPPESEREYYDRLFHHANQTKPEPTASTTTNGGTNINNISTNINNIILPPNQAAQLFLLAGIPSDRLRMIWNMAVMPLVPYPPDMVDPPPAMSVDQFRVAVRLIQLFQNRVTAKDERLAVDNGNEGIGTETKILTPAYFEGVSGALVPLPGTSLPTNATPPPSRTMGRGSSFSRRHSSEEEEEEEKKNAGGHDSATTTNNSNKSGGNTDDPASDSKYGMSDATPYRGTFARHCVTEMSPSRGTSVSERHVYVDEAVSLFSKTGLPRDVLGKLWDVVVSDPDAGKLDEAEFVLMAHLAFCVTKRGLGVPATLPAPLQAWRDAWRGGGGNVDANGNVGTVHARHQEQNNDANVKKENVEQRHHRQRGTINGEGAPVHPDNNRLFVPIKRASNITVSVDSDNPGSKNNNGGGGDSSDQFRYTKQQKKDDDQRIERMELQIASLKELVVSLTDEVRDLKDIVRRSPASGGREGGGTLHHDWPRQPPAQNGIGGSVVGSGTTEGGGGDSVPTARSYQSSNDDVPNVDLEVYWGKKLDDSDKTVESNDKPSSTRAVSPMPSTSIPPSAASSPKRSHPSLLPNLQQRPQLRQQPPPPTSRRVSQNIPQMHPSALGKQPSLRGAAAVASRRNQLLPNSMPSQSRVAGQHAMPVVSQGGAAHSMPTGMGDVQASQMKQAQQGERVDTWSSNNNSMPQSRAPVMSNINSGVATSMAKGIGDAQTLQMNQTQQGERLGPRASRNSHSMYNSMPPQSRVPGQHAMPIMRTFNTTSNQVTNNVQASQLKQAQQVGRSNTTRASRNSHSMYNSMPPQSRVPGQQNTPVASNGSVGTTKSIPNGRPPSSLSKSLTWQMKQVQREEKFNSLLHKTINKIGNVTTASETNSLASSFNSRAQSHQQPRASILRSSMPASGGSATRPRATFQTDNNAASASKSPQLNPVATAKKGGRRSQFAKGRRASLIDSSRHITRRSSGESEVYKVAMPASTAAVDLPPL